MDELRGPDENPYQSPGSQAGQFGHPPSTRDLRRDVLVIVISVLCTAVVGRIVGFLVSRYSGPAGLYTLESLPALCRARSLGFLGGKLPFDFLCGMLLGRYLERVNPWTVLLAISVFSFLLYGVLSLVSALNDDLYVEAVGVSGAVFWTVVLFCEIPLVIAGGILWARWSRWISGSPGNCAKSHK